MQHTLKYGCHIEVVNLSPGLSQMSSFHVQKLQAKTQLLQSKRSRTEHL